MVTYMNDQRIRTLDDVRSFLEGTAEVEFSIENRDERYRWIQATLLKFRYASLGRAEILFFTITTCFFGRNMAGRR